MAVRMRLVALALLAMAGIADAGFIDITGSGGGFTAVGNDVLGDVQVQQVNAVGTPTSGTFADLGDLNISGINFTLTLAGVTILDGIFTDVEVTHPGEGFTFVAAIGGGTLGRAFADTFGVEQFQSAALTVTGLNGTATSTDLTLTGLSAPVIPEPTSLILCGMGLALAASTRWRRRKVAFAAAAALVAAVPTPAPAQCVDGVCVGPPTSAFRPSANRARGASLGLNFRVGVGLNARLGGAAARSAPAPAPYAPAPSSGWTSAGPVQDLSSSCYSARSFAAPSYAPAPSERVEVVATSACGPTQDPSSIVAWLNARRAALGLGPLADDAGLRAWSVANNRARRDRGEGAREVSPWRYQVGGTGSVVADLAAWERSPQHRAVLRDPSLTRVGFDDDGTYWTIHLD